MAKYLKNYVNQQRTFFIDSEADVSDLPTHKKNKLGFYSFAVVADTANVYILKSTDEWVLFGGAA